MTKLERLTQVAQRDADRTGKPLAILNLNPYNPLYVIREWRDTYPAREVVAKIEPQTHDEAGGTTGAKMPGFAR